MTAGTARRGIDSPVGPLILIATDGAITAIRWGRAEPTTGVAVLDQAAEELVAYFDRRQTGFSVPVRAGQSSFQLAFLAALSAIPYGETRTYGDLAAELGVSAQAVGQACGANPVPIIIPCHRVLAASGLGGYSGGGGIEAKVALLRLEGAAGLLI